MRSATAKPGRSNVARRRLVQLLAALALLVGTAVASSGCAIHAHGRPIPLRLRTVAVHVTPPPPPRAERCTSHRMCNIWGICRTRVVCTPMY